MKRRPKRMVNREKVETIKAKIAFAIMIIFASASDSGMAYPIIAMLASLWLLVIGRRLERMGAFDEC
jgi:hypothetical protein